ncbi:hypothetical protein ABW20_dc0105695 [Dactylellina cionopaga]|nr:hypothetical protein ABW20_dc0105695 [Dactylellina cionopaga]
MPLGIDDDDDEEDYEFSYEDDDDYDDDDDSVTGPYPPKRATIGGQQPISEDESRYGQVRRDRSRSRSRYNRVAAPYPPTYGIPASIPAPRHGHNPTFSHEERAHDHRDRERETGRDARHRPTYDDDVLSRYRASLERAEHSEEAFRVLPNPRYDSGPRRYNAAEPADPRLPARDEERSLWQPPPSGYNTEDIRRRRRSPSVEEYIPPPPSARSDVYDSYVPSYRRRPSDEDISRGGDGGWDSRYERPEPSDPDLGDPAAAARRRRRLPHVEERAFRGQESRYERHRYRPSAEDPAYGRGDFGFPLRDEDRRSRRRQPSDSNPQDTALALVRRRRSPEGPRVEREVVSYPPPRRRRDDRDEGNEPRYRFER